MEGVKKFTSGDLVRAAASGMARVQEGTRTKKHFGAEIVGGCGLKKEEG